MTDLELTRRLAVTDRCCAGRVADVLTGLSLVLVLLAELHQHGERLRHLEVNLRQRQAGERRRAEGTAAPSRLSTGRPVGRPRKPKPNDAVATWPAAMHFD